MNLLKLEETSDFSNLLSEKFLKAGKAFLYFIICLLKSFRIVIIIANHYQKTNELRRSVLISTRFSDFCVFKSITIAQLRCYFFY